MHSAGFALWQASESDVLPQNGSATTATLWTLTGQACHIDAIGSALFGRLAAGSGRDRVLARGLMPTAPNGTPGPRARAPPWQFARGSRSAGRRRVSAHAGDGPMAQTTICTNVTGRPGTICTSSTHRRCAGLKPDTFQPATVLAAIKTKPAAAAEERPVLTAAVRDGRPSRQVGAKGCSRSN